MLRRSVVMTANRRAIVAAAWNAASPIPTTGASVSSRAAPTPGSPKHATRYASCAGSSRTSAATAAAATTESASLSIEVGPRSGETAVTSQPSGSVSRATCAHRLGMPGIGVRVDEGEAEHRPHSPLAAGSRCVPSE